MRSCYSGSNTNIYTFIDTTDIADFGIKKKKKKREDLPYPYSGELLKGMDRWIRKLLHDKVITETIADALGNLQWQRCLL